MTGEILKEAFVLEEMELKLITLISNNNYLKFHSNEIGSIAIHAVNGNKSIAVGRYHVAILFEL